MTGDREFRELAELARTAERLTRPMPAPQVRRLATRRRRRTVLGAAATVAALALGGGIAVSGGRSVLGQAPEPAITPPGVERPTAGLGTPRPDEPSEPRRELSRANLLKASEIPRYGSQRVVVAEKGAGRPAARISLCFPDRGVAKLKARDSRSRNFARRGGGGGAPGGDQTTGPGGEPSRPPASEPPASEPSGPAEPTGPPDEPTPPPPEPSHEPTEEPTSPPPEPTDPPTDEPGEPTASPDTSAPSDGDPTSSRGRVPADPAPGRETSGGPTDPDQSAEDPPARAGVYTTVLQFADARTADKAYERILDWRKDCEDTLADRGYRLLDSGWRVPVTVDGRRVGEFVEVTYRRSGDSSGSRTFESTGVALVADRVMVTVSVVSGEDYQVSLDPEGDRQTGQSAHPQFALIRAAAERLVR